MIIRPACAEDWSAIWSIIEPIIRAGETYTLDLDMGKADALGNWFGAEKETFVAEEDRVILGTYYMRPNQAGGGRHVCNCGFMTDARARAAGLRGEWGSMPWRMQGPAATEPCSSISL
jgi:hypothetical protein